MLKSPMTSVLKAAHHMVFIFQGSVMTYVYFHVYQVARRLGDAETLGSTPHSHFDHMNYQRESR